MQGVFSYEILVTSSFMLMVGGVMLGERGLNFKIEDKEDRWFLWGRARESSIESSRKEIECFKGRMLYVIGEGKWKEKVIELVRELSKSRNTHERKEQNNQVEKQERKYNAIKEKMRSHIKEKIQKGNRRCGKV